MDRPDDVPTHAVDLNETPAVPPEDPGGDERAGFLAAGALLIVIGLGFGVLLNLAVHALALPSGSAVGPWVVTPTLGAYGWAMLGIGAGTGCVGAGLVGLGLRSPRGPLRLPGTPY